MQAAEERDVAKTRASTAEEAMSAVMAERDAVRKERDAALEKVADLESLLPPKLREEWERIQAVKARGS